MGVLGWEDPLEKGTATFSNILAWRISWTIPWGCKELDMTERLLLSLSKHIHVKFSSAEVHCFISYVLGLLESSGHL